jgi:hypothetical protein
MRFNAANSRLMLALLAFLELLSQQEEAHSASLPERRFISMVYVSTGP